MTVLKYLKWEAGAGEQVSVRTKTLGDSGMFNTAALGIIKSKTNQLVLLGCLEWQQFLQGICSILWPRW